MSNNGIWTPFTFDKKIKLSERYDKEVKNNLFSSFQIIRTIILWFWGDPNLALILI